MNVHESDAERIAKLEAELMRVKTERDLYKKFVSILIREIETYENEKPMTEAEARALMNDPNLVSLDTVIADIERQFGARCAMQPNEGERMWEDVKLQSPDPAQFFSGLNDIIVQLPKDVRKQLLEIRSNYIARFDIEGARLRLEGRTVRQVFDEFDGQLPVPIKSGERDGVRYELYKPPSDTVPT